MFERLHTHTTPNTMALSSTTTAISAKRRRKRKAPSLLEAQGRNGLRQCGRRRRCRMCCSRSRIQHLAPRTRTHSRKHRPARLPVPATGCLDAQTKRSQWRQRAAYDRQALATFVAAVRFKHAVEYTAAVERTRQAEAQRAETRHVRGRPGDPRHERRTHPSKDRAAAAVTSTLLGHDPRKSGGNIRAENG